MIVRANIPYCLEYPTFDQQTGLFVGARIIDITSGLPGSQVGNVLALTDETDGLYRNVFTPAAGKRYRVIKQLYTDGTYTTVDTGRAPDIEVLDAADLVEKSDLTPLFAADLIAEVAEPEFVTAEIIEETIEATVVDC